MIVVDKARLPIIDDLRKASTDNFVTALEEIGHVVPERGGKVGELGTKEFAELFNKAVQEMQRGVSLCMDMVTVLAKKTS